MVAHNVVVRMYYSGSWHDLTAANVVRTSQTITTSRKGCSLSSRLSPGGTTLQLNNANGTYNPANPASPIYGLAGRGTPIDISVDGTTTWTGEACDWVPVRDVTDIMTTTVTCGGILRRLGIGTPPVTSPLSAKIISLFPNIYLPLTEGPFSNAVGTPVSGYNPQDIGNIKFGETDGPPGDTRKLPNMLNSTYGGVASQTISLTPTIGPDFTLKIVAKAGRKPTTTGELFNILTWRTGMGTTSETYWNLMVLWDGSSATDTIILSSNITSSGDSYNLSISQAEVLDDNWHNYSVSVSWSGSTIDAAIEYDGVEIGSSTDTMPPGNLDTLYMVSNSTDDLLSASVGHIAIWDSATVVTTQTAFEGYPGEYAADRLQRLCTERGISSAVIGTVASDSQPMGIQPTDTLLNCLQDTVATDGGVAYEGTDGILTLRCYGDLINQTPVDIPLTSLVTPLTPSLGDKNARNDVTARRASGSSSRATLDTGAMGTQDPPTGIGRIPTEVIVNPELDSSLADYASWLLAISTQPDLTYTQITLDLDADATLDISGIDIGALTRITGIDPIDDPNDPVLMVMGINDTTATNRRLITLDLVTGSLYQTGKLNTLGYLDCGATLTNETLDTTETGVDVVITDACVWTHADGDYNILIGGELMTVTAVSATTGTYPTRYQTLTVTRSVNGVIKSHATSAEVHVANPIILTL